MIYCHCIIRTSENVWPGYYISWTIAVSVIAQCQVNVMDARILGYLPYHSWWVIMIGNLCFFSEFWTPDYLLFKLYERLCESKLINCSVVLLSIIVENIGNYFSYRQKPFTETLPRLLQTVLFLIKFLCSFYVIPSIRVESSTNQYTLVK